MDNYEGKWEIHSMNYVIIFVTYNSCFVDQILFKIYS
jgi:hypothetical protein